jgi:hypothetical protein
MTNDIDFAGGVVYMNIGGTVYEGFVQIATGTAVVDLLRDTSGSVTATSPATFNAVITAGSFIVGRTYVIVTVGTTDFTLIGAASNTIGVSFQATGVGTGDGTAKLTGDFTRWSLTYPN